MRLAAVLAACCALAGGGRAEIIAGRAVQDDSGIPLATVEVKVAKIGQRELAADLETDAQLRFAGPELGPGEYRIEISKPNYATAAMRLRVPGSATGALLVRLARLAVITGRVVDADGRALAGANVYAMVHAPGGGAARPAGDAGWDALRARVDGEGEYRLNGVPPGEYALAASYGASTLVVGSTGNDEAAPGVGSGTLFYPDNAQPRWFTISGGEQLRNIDFTVRPSALYHVAGTVQLPQAKAQAWVAATPVDLPGMAGAVAEAKPDGSFRLEGLAPGAYLVSAVGPVRARAGMGAFLDDDSFFGRVRVSVVAAHVEGVAIPVQGARSVVLTLGAAGDHAGCPPSVAVTLTSLEDWAAVVDRTVNLSFGKEQKVGGLAPGWYSAALAKAGDGCYQASETMFDAAEGKPAVVTVAAAGSIRGELAGRHEGGWSWCSFPSAWRPMPSDTRSPWRTRRANSNSRVCGRDGITLRRRREARSHARAGLRIWRAW